MMPLVFMVETSIHKDDEVLKKQFLFASRKEVELFKDALRPWGMSGGYMRRRLYRRRFGKSLRNGAPVSETGKG